MPPWCLVIDRKPSVTVLAPFYLRPLGKLVGNNAVPFLCFKDVLLRESSGFGFAKEPCHLAGPGSRYVCVFLMPSAFMSAAGVKCFCCSQ